jgi:hypothetical protein
MGPVSGFCIPDLLAKLHFLGLTTFGSRWLLRKRTDPKSCLVFYLIFVERSSTIECPHHPPHTHKKTRRDYILISTVTHSHTISLYCELHNLYINNRIKFHTNCCNPLQKHSSFAQPQSKCLLLFL